MNNNIDVDKTILELQERVARLEARFAINPHNVPEGWLHIAGIGFFQDPPNRCRRFLAWLLLGWKWKRNV